MGHPFTGVKARPQHVLASGYRCPQCGGKGYTDDGRVRVHHNSGCKIWMWITLRHPQLSRILEQYRTPNYR